MIFLTDLDTIFIIAGNYTKNLNCVCARVCPYDIRLQKKLCVENTILRVAL